MTPTSSTALRGVVLATALGVGAQASAQGTSVNLTDATVAIETRVQHAKALGTDPSPTAIDELLTGLDSRSEPLREAIIASLKAKKGDVVLLERALDKKRPVPARVAALAGLRVLKPADSAARIAALLDDADEGVREAAAHTLVVVGPALAEAKLVSALRAETSAKVRYFVVVALGCLKTATAKAAIAARAKIETDFAVKDALDQAATKQAQPANP